MKKSGSKGLIKYIINIGKATITIALLYWVIQSAGLMQKEGFNDFITSVKNASWLYLLISILFVPIMDIVSTIKWYFIVRSKKINVSYTRLLSYYVVGRFFNMVLPSSIGGDLIRIHLLGRDTGRLAESAAIVFVERITGLITLVLATIAALFAAAGVFSEVWLKWSVLAAGLGLLTLIAGLIVDGIYFPMTGMLSRLHPFLQQLFNKIEKMRGAIKSMSIDKSMMLTAFINSIFFYIVAVLNAWTSILVFNTEIPLVTMIIAIPIIMFIMNIPISVGNLGIMEFAYTAVLTAFGVSPSVALSLAILMRLKIFLGAGFGAIVYQFVSLNIGSKKDIENELIAESKIST
jgi:uncharacterized protein (TIRG00374 family)